MLRSGSRYFQFSWSFALVACCLMVPVPGFAQPSGAGAPQIPPGMEGVITVTKFTTQTEEEICEWAWYHCVSDEACQSKFDELLEALAAINARIDEINSRMDELFEELDSMPTDADSLRRAQEDWRRMMIDEYSRGQGGTYPPPRPTVTRIEKRTSEIEQEVTELVEERELLESEKAALEDALNALLRLMEGGELVLIGCYSLPQLYPVLFDLNVFLGFL